jgi:hypothetical protein
MARVGVVMGELGGLRLVVGTGVVALAEATAQTRAQRELRAKMAAIAAANGANAYTDFILKHGRRPDPVDAAVIGRLLGKRVRASDGTMQPQPSKAERDALKSALMLSLVGSVMRSHFWLRTSATLRC